MSGRHGAGKVEVTIVDLHARLLSPGLTMDQNPLSSLGSWPGSVREDGGGGDKMEREMGGKALYQRHLDESTG